MDESLFDYFIEHIEKEWALISGAPFLMFLTVCLIGFLGYVLFGKLHEGRHALHEGTVEQKDARIEFLEGQIEDYKGKLSGASPDQAAAKMEALAANLQTAMNAVADLTRWKEHETFERHLSPEQRARLCEMLRVIPIEARAFVFLGSVQEREAQTFGLELLGAFKAEGYCGTQAVPRPLYFNSPDEMGVMVVVRDELNPPAHATAIMNALHAAGVTAKLDTWVAPEGPRQVFPPMFCLVGVSHKPPLS